MLVGDDRELGVVLDAEAGVDQLAVHLAGERGVGQARADRGGDFGDGHRLVERALAAVGERDIDHVLGSLLQSWVKKDARRPS